MSVPKRFDGFGLAGSHARCEPATKMREFCDDQQWRVSQFGDDYGLDVACAWRGFNQ
jgi:hypothetical protein